jgi:ubiquinone biosynthesis protein
MFRFFKILWVMNFHFILFPLSSRLRSRGRGERLRLALERLGLTFVKAGQVLAASRLLSGPVQDELEKLFETATPLPFEVVREVVEFELGSPLEEVFERFDCEPLASASIAQVHRALMNNEEVIVKAQRPGAGTEVRRDMRLMKTILLLGSLVSRRVRSFRAARLPDHMEGWMLGELDFRREAENGRAGAEEYEGTGLLFPAVRFASRQLIIQEFLPGVPLSRWTEDMRSQGFDAHASLTTFLRVFFGRLFGREEAALIHGDPHPANLLVLTGGRMGIIDTGLVGRFTAAELRIFNDLVFAVYAGSAEGATEGLLSLCRYSFSSHGKEVAFEQDVSRFIAKAQHRQFSYWFTEPARILIRHGVPMPELFSLVSRCGVIIDGVTQMFFPGATTHDLVGHEIREGIMRRAVAAMTLDPVPFLYSLTRAARRLPHEAGRVVEHPVDALADILGTLAVSLRESTG